MEPEVWVIVRYTGVVHGHGDNRDEPVLAYKGYNVDDSHPAFMSKKAANRYLKGLEAYGLRAKKLELREE